MATLIWSVAASATGGDYSEARRLFHQGRQLYNQGEFPAALSKFRRARELYRSEKVDLSIGFTLEKMGRIAEAAGYYERFLLKGSEGVGRAVEDKVFAKLKGIRKELATIRVSIKVDGAVIEIDGKARARSPQRHRIYVIPGYHRLTVKRLTRVLYSRQVSLAAGQYFQVRADAGGGAPRKAGQQRSDLAGGKGWLAPKTKRPQSTPFYKKWWFWTAVGAVVTGATVGIAVSVGGDDWRPHGDSGTIDLTQ